MSTKQRFPAVTIEALGNGLFRLEDESYSEGAAVDLHPAQIQVLASMAGFTMPDRIGTALERIASRLHALSKQAEELEGHLRDDLLRHNMDVQVELTMSEFIAHKLAEFVIDVEAMQAPDIELAPDAAPNPGGQLCLPMGV